MTLLELRTLVLNLVDDPNGGYFTSTVVNGFLNTAQRELQKQLIQAGENYYLKPVETTTVTNQADYVLPSDFIEALRLEIVLSGSGITEDKRKLECITLNQQDIVASNRTGTSMFYVIRKDRITLFPCPDRAYTLRLYYSYRVADMSSDSDSPDAPIDFHEYIALLAAKDCFIKDDRVSTNIDAKIAVYTASLKKAAENRDQSASRSVRISNDDSFGGF